MTQVQIIARHTIKEGHEDQVLLERYASREALAAHRQAPHVTGLLLAQIVPQLETRSVEEYDVSD